MHKLDRPRAPACLNKYRHGRDRWKDVTSEDKTEIWNQLNEMQQQRCAYCETAIRTSKNDRNSHIEHLRQRSRYPQGAFEWSNIFGSCNRTDSCGNYKDRLPVYNWKELIKMDDEDPESFLIFLPDGRVVPRAGLDNHQEHRANETIRIFNLNGSLRQIRYSHVQGYEQTANELMEFVSELGEDDYFEALEQELEAIKGHPFETAIKHMLLPA